MGDVGGPSDSMVSHVWMRIARLFNRLYVSHDLQSAGGASMSDNQSGKSEKKLNIQYLNCGAAAKGSNRGKFLATAYMIL